MSRRRRGRSTGPPTECVCPVCEHRTKKTRGLPCRSMKYPKCGHLMIRPAGISHTSAETVKNSKDLEDED